MVCMARFLSSNGRISTHFDDIHLKLSKHGYFEVRFHSMLSNMKILKLDFCDNIIIELYTCIGAIYLLRAHCNGGNLNFASCFRTT